MIIQKVFISAPEALMNPSFDEIEMATSRYAFPSCAALILAGCVSMDYGEIQPQKSRPYGYGESRRDDGTYVLRVQHPDGKTAHAFWDRRAEELCGNRNYTKNIFQAIRPTVFYQTYGGMPGVFFLEGYLKCETAAPTSSTSETSKPALPEEKLDPLAASTG